MKKIRFIFLFIYLFLIVLIFLMAGSSGEESTKQSDVITDVTIDVVDTFRPEDKPIEEKYTREQISHFVRKSIGHFGLFFTCGLFGILSFYLFVKFKLLSIILNLLSGFLISGISEVIQMFADSRGPSFNDVLLDFSGYILSFIIVYVIILLVNRKKSKIND